VGRFVEGFFTRQRTVRDTLTIIGLGADPERYGARLAPVIVPVATGRRFASAGFNLDADPAALLGSLRTGTLFAAGPDSGAGYPQVTLELARSADHAAVRDSVESLGFEAFSYAEQFAEIQRFHLYFYAGLGVIGILALLTAALGIVNTLVMSVTERRREIGVLKSLGADEIAIRWLFVVEAALIGLAGSLVGIGLGWLGTRVVRLIMQAIMSREGMPAYEPFALPVWLVLLALGFGVTVAVAAGAFPAARAARVDPVAALRGE
jgi:putative ABC transport system permease protein